MIRYIVPFAGLVTALLAGCSRPLFAPAPGAGGADTAPLPAPVAPAPATAAPVARVVASVCVLGCSGPRPVDADGNVYAATFIDVDAMTAITGLSVTRCELIDSAGTVIAHGAPSAPLTVVARDGSVVGPFSGSVAAGAHVRLWVSMRLDAKLPELERAPPARFRLTLAAEGGVTLEAIGAVSSPGATG